MSEHAQPSFTPPHGYTRIKLVQSFHELVTTRFEDGVNALCWPRTLEGDFGEVVAQLAVSEGIATLDEARLQALNVSPAGRVAIDFMLNDYRRLREHGLAPVLDCIQSYPRDEEPDIVSTDVYSFHADSAPVETDTYLCTYYGPSSEGLRHEDAVRRVDIPETRAELLDLYGGTEDDEFLSFLHECCYDLHYASHPGTQPFAFGLGNLWRIAVEYPESPVPPCIHRAPETQPSDPARLLLIS
jgi:hypothetical protein